MEIHQPAQDLPCVVLDDGLRERSELFDQVMNASSGYILEEEIQHPWGSLNAKYCHNVRVFQVSKKTDLMGKRRHLLSDLLVFSDGNLFHGHQRASAKVQRKVHLGKCPHTQKAALPPHNL